MALPGGHLKYLTPRLVTPSEQPFKSFSCVCVCVCVCVYDLRSGYVINNDMYNYACMYSNMIK